MFKIIFKDNIKNLILLFLISLILGIFSTLDIYFINNLFNNLKNTAIKKDVLFYNILFISISSLITIIFSLTWFLINNNFKNQINKKIQKIMIQKTINQDIARFKDLDTGEYISWMNRDAKEITANFVENIISLGSVAIMLLSSSVLSFIIEWRLTLIAIAFLVIILLSYILTFKIQLKISERNMVIQNQLQGALFWMQKGYFSLFYLNKEEIFARELSNTYQNVLIGSIKIFRKQFLIETINLLIVFTFEVLFLIFAGYFYLNYNHNIGLLYSLPAYIMLMVKTFEKVISQIRDVLSHKNIYKDRFSNIENKNYNNNRIEINKIEIKNLTFAYETNPEKHIFKNFSFTFEKGKKYAIVGASGSGKSTLLKILTGEITNYDGQILINDKDLKTIKNDEFKNSFSFIDSNEFVFNDTIYNNVALWEENKENEVRESLNLVGMSDFDLNFLCSDDENNLSTGQKQKINFARFILSKKKVLLMDEALANLDSKSLNDLQKIIFEDSDLMLINITHHLKDASGYDEIIKMEEII